MHWLGYYYIQDPVSVLPVEALQLEKGEQVLDLCAAPGGKGLYMGQLLGNEGTVVANEPDGKRRQVLQSNIQRLGAANLVLTAYDGRVVPEGEKFSAILVDAPCSGEGAQRYPEEPPDVETKSQHQDLAERQYGLLEKAYRILEPGGRVVYSTCTYNPLENEAVVTRLLQNTGARMVDVDFDYPHGHGVREWENHQFHPEVEMIWRCYPHHYNGGGMAFALLEKPED